jgi:hypothetical protein
LHRCLSKANLSALVDYVQAVRSEESVLIQLADVLTGSAASRLNETLRRGSAKERVVEQLESALGNGIRATSRDEQKFNVFVMDLHGGW